MIDLKEISNVLTKTRDELIIIRSWLDEETLKTKAKQKLTNLIKELKDE